MKLHTFHLTRAAALGVAVLAFSTATIGTAHASRPLLEAPSMFVPSATAAVAVTQLVTAAQADNIRVELGDLGGN
jgi:hypothetical protein